MGIIVELKMRTQEHNNAELNESDGMLSVYKWTGTTKLLEDGSCVPSMFLAETTKDCQEHLTIEHHRFKKGSGLKFYF